MFIKKICKLTAVALSLMILAVPAMSDTTIDPERASTLTIHYNDTVDGEDAVAGAVFTAYKVADIGPYGSYESIVPELAFSDETAQNAVYVNEYTDPSLYVPKVLDYYSNNADKGAMYQCTTDKGGVGVMQGIETGAYLIYETQAAPEHIETTPFIVSLPFKSDDISDYGWSYDMVCQPKSTPTGRLSITKTLKGNDTEKEREFHFDVTFSNDLEYECFNGSKVIGKISNGGTIALKGGETVEIKGIPAGTLYTITEQEANKDGYTTEVNNNEGFITKYKTTGSEFINTREKEEPTPTPTSTPTPTATPTVTPTATPVPVNGGTYSGGVAGAGPIQTGDENMLMTVAIMFMAMGIIGINVFAMKKKKN